MPVSETGSCLDTLAAYVESLPAAWADADQVKRNELLSVLFEAIFVDGPVVEFVRPREEWIQLFNAREGAAQPQLGGLGCQANVALATPMGIGRPSANALFLPTGGFKPQRRGQSRRLAVAGTDGGGHRLCHQCLVDNDQATVMERGRPGLPHELWPTVAAQVASGATLR